ncbi:MAG: Phasin [Rhodobacterales bacterium 32-67-9]|nr:MAG: Phasin [Rhodobacterales bacterium 32-67-9]
MQKAQDFTKVMQDFTASLPFDAKAFQETFKSSAAFGEKMTKVALEAAEKSSEISSKWTKDTIAKVGTLAKVKEEPTDYSKALSDFASAAAEMAAENLAAFAEVAKKAQMETVELMLAAGKDISEDATAAVKKAQADVTSAAKKAAASATAAVK